MSYRENSGFKRVRYAGVNCAQSALYTPQVSTSELYRNLYCAVHRSISSIQQKQPREVGPLQVGRVYFTEDRCATQPLLKFAHGEDSDRNDKHLRHGLVLRKSCLGTRHGKVINVIPRIAPAVRPTNSGWNSEDAVSSGLR